MARVGSFPSLKKLYYNNFEMLCGLNWQFLKLKFKGEDVKKIIKGRLMDFLVCVCVCVKPLFLSV